MLQESQAGQPVDRNLRPRIWNAVRLRQDCTAIAEHQPRTI